VTAFHLVFAAILSVIPIHGSVLDRLPDGSAIIRTDATPLMLPAAIRRYRVDPPAAAVAGSEIDALLDTATQPWTLHDALTSGPFTPGLPEPARVVPLDIGSSLPAAILVDQSGRRVQIDRALQGKTSLVTFIFTRCPDRTLCPALSGKFAYLQAHLDPKRFALVEITLDPPYDSPAVLHRYAAVYGADPAIWTLLTGTGSSIKHVLDEFRISSMRVSASNFLHDDKLFIAAPNGRIAFIAQTASWDPQAVLSQARAIAGLSSNPLERFRLSLIAGVVALCGGSQFAGIVLLELALFAIIVLVVTAILWWVARILWAKS